MYCKIVQCTAKRKTESQLDSQSERYSLVGTVSVEPTSIQIKSMQIDEDSARGERATSACHVTLKEGRGRPWLRQPVGLHGKSARNVDTHEKNARIGRARNPRMWRKPRARELRDRDFASEFENSNTGNKIVLNPKTRSNIVLKPTTIRKIAVIHTNTTTVMERDEFNHILFTLLRTSSN
jgi:hypothetical protein